METTLIERIQGELEMIESIYAEDGVIAEPARETSVYVNDNNNGELQEQVECILKLTPNTGFNMEKIAVIVFAKFTFKSAVSYNFLLQDHNKLRESYILNDEMAKLQNNSQL